jgi:hypothetical protein
MKIISGLFTVLKKICKTEKSQLKDESFVQLCPSGWDFDIRWLEHINMPDVKRGCLYFRLVNWVSSKALNNHDLQNFAANRGKTESPSAANIE